MQYVTIITAPQKMADYPHGNVPDSVVSIWNQMTMPFHMKLQFRGAECEGKIIMYKFRSPFKANRHQSPENYFVYVDEAIEALRECYGRNTVTSFELAWWEKWRRDMGMHKNGVFSFPRNICSIYPRIEYPSPGRRVYYS